jgi:hypothetical protein
MKKRQYLVKKHLAEVWQENKWRVENPAHIKMVAVIE